MKTGQIIRIAVLLVVIFGAGVLTGRMLTPRPRAMILTGTGRYSTSDTALGRLKRHFDLSAEQEGQFATLLEEIAQEMSQLPPGSPERLALFRRNIPKIESLLRPEQRTNFQEYVRTTEMRFQRQMRRQERKENAGGSENR